ncbi:DNA cytosine methyltransferase [Serratia fonticola]|uniref:DNA cytosine methyltransferase n=1 Tax=Serratia fonticola TaxID=47917 RepID=UPI001FD86A22|nr:DNA cytosine methyltransferase [Serratia fonticola]
MVNVVDLFCGAGGLTYGLQQAGLRVIAGYDIDPTCRYAYEKNNNSLFVQKSVTDLGENELLKHYQEGSLKVLAGCAPCQPFSSYSKQSQKSLVKKNDQRWALLYSFSKQIKNVKPDIVTMENVPGLLAHQVFHDFVRDLKSQGYHVWYNIVYCPEYGMAQTRSRLVLLASLLGDIELIPPTHTKDNYKTLREVIGYLPPVSAGETDPIDQLHRAASLSEINLKRIIASKPGGTWKDWPESLLAECHKKASGASYTAVYGRMSWDKLGSTVTTQCTGYGNGRFGHPEQNRAITLREAAILQSFPRDYDFWPKERPVENKNVARMIGNAVPVRLGEVVGISIKNHIEKHINK